MHIKRTHYVRDHYYTTSAKGLGYVGGLLKGQFLLTFSTIFMLLQWLGRKSPKIRGRNVRMVPNAETFIYSLGEWLEQYKKWTIQFREMKT